MVERELQRQRMLREMGFAAWVAQTPLPGAMASPVLGAKPSAPTRSTAPAAAPQATAKPTPAANSSPQELLAQVRAGLGGKKPQATPAPSIESTTVEPAAQASPRTPMRFTLQVLPMRFGYLMVQQKDPSAPSFSRDEQRLLQGFTALWGGYHGMARTFACPMGRQPMYTEDAKEALTGYLSALSEATQASQHHVLVLADAEVAALMVAKRYVPEPLGDGQLLVVSSLAEMLATPLPHKKISWDAILTAQLYAHAQHS